MTTIQTLARNWASYKKTHEMKGRAADLAARDFMQGAVCALLATGQNQQAQDLAVFVMVTAARGCSELDRIAAAQESTS